MNPNVRDQIMDIANRATTDIVRDIMGKFEIDVTSSIPEIQKIILKAVSSGADIVLDRLQKTIDKHK